MMQRSEIRIAHVATVDVTLKALLRSQVSYLLGRGYDVEMIASAGPHTPRLRADGFTVHNVRISRKIEPVRDLMSTLRLARLFRQQRYQLIRTHTSKAGFVGRLAARLAGVPLVVHTAHGFFFHENMGPLPRRIFQEIERLAGRWTDMLFLQSGEDYQSVLDYGLVPAEKARRLGNGIDLDRFDPAALRGGEAATQLRRELFGAGEYFMLLCVASMIERKGHVHLIRAVRRLRDSLPGLRVLLVGLGPLLETLRETVRSAGLDGIVQFAGYRDDVVQLMAAADVYVLPSLSEGMPRSIIEAMAMDCPVIASDIRGSRELVTNRQTGILFPPGDDATLADAIGQLAGDPDLKRRLGQAGRERALAEYDERQVFARLEAGYNELFTARGWIDDGK